MNELGLGAFDSSGATAWLTETMPVSSDVKWVEFDVGVANVGDALYDSQVIVSKLGDLTCDQCGSCDTCPGDPMCQPNCKNPPPQSCAFYAGCAEARLQCGATGYPLRYGQHFCLSFQKSQDSFSTAGQAFIWNTMHCLQLKLVDAIDCDSTCASVEVAAFDSHPGCYVESGFCSLGPWDLLHVFWVVKAGLIGNKMALVQVTSTLKSCGALLLQKIEDEIQSLLAHAVEDAVNAAGYLAKAAAMSIFRKIIQGPTPTL